MRKGHPLGKLLGLVLLLVIIAYIIYGMRGGHLGVSGKAYTGQNVQVLSYPDCMDSDHGKEYWTRGSTYNIKDGGVYDDFCEDWNELVEYFCNNDYVDRITIRCECYFGACR